ncbi:OB-fold domain-containing protein [Lysinibacillus sp. FJAT-14222]|uniref:Zn-ribbon domain-containing OB-fold protein n=1 Tax=Lysinibacillus sp. FJAT-14222 TaxID=1932366 RepID=UPI0006B06787|nr:OB-fold domain-containing protein [Lysinibacillus sp. FJAT-14222]KOS63790.1 nucleic acid-binding protein [Lysinibacillus sp. FJAT-14222]
MKVYECCGVESVRKKVYCSTCRQEIKNEREVPDEGTVYSYSVIHIAPAEYTHLAPYTVALVQLKNSTAKLTVRIHENVQIGDFVQLDQIVDGTYIYQKSSTA